MFFMLKIHETISFFLLFLNYLRFLCFHYWEHLESRMLQLCRKFINYILLSTIFHAKVIIIIIHDIFCGNIMET